MTKFPIKAEQDQQRNDADLDTLNHIIDGSEDLNKIAQAYKLLEKRNDNELHNIRKIHLNRLFLFTCVWSSIVVFVLISLGLHRLWWFPTCCNFIALPFNLENSVVIAFITSTTATIIGLYTIAAYWLFKKKD